MQRGFRKLRLLGYAVILGCLAGTLLGDKAPKKKPGDKAGPTAASPFSLKVPVDVVVVNVAVTNKEGKPVKDLTRDDFKLLEDGKSQAIHTFSLETYKKTQPAEKTSRPAGQSKQLETNTAEKAIEETSASQPRFISLMFDDVTIYEAEISEQVIGTMKKFIANNLLADDLVSMATVSGLIQFPFTSDKHQLQQNLEELRQKKHLRVSYRSQCPTLTDLQALQIVQSSGELNDTGDLTPPPNVPGPAPAGAIETLAEEVVSKHPTGSRALDIAIGETIRCAHLESMRNPASAALSVIRPNASSQYSEMQFRNIALLRGLRQHIRSLRMFDGRKSLFLFSKGFISEELRFQLQDVVNQALRSGVIINTLDAHGLVVGRLSAADAVNLPMMLQNWKNELIEQSRVASESPLVQLASDTGGVFVHDNNDLYGGMKEISERETSYYVLTYVSPYLKADGSYHKIKLDVRRPGVQLKYRMGYFSPSEELTYETRQKEDILEALRAPGHVNQIPLQLLYSFQQMDEGHYQMDLVTDIAFRRLPFQVEEARHKNVISVVVIVFDEHDHYVDGVQKTMEFNLSDSSYAAMQKSGLQSKTGLIVPPGRYLIKAVVRDSYRNRLGSTTQFIEMP